MSDTQTQYYSYADITTLYDDARFVLFRPGYGSYNITGSVLKAQILTSPAITGNLSFSGTGNRITGDFSNATVANRVHIQTNVTDGATFPSILPNGTNTSAGLQIRNASDPNNSSAFSIQTSALGHKLASTINGTGVLQPIALRMNAIDHCMLSTNGNFIIKTGAVNTDDDGGNKLQVTGGIKSDQYKLSALNTAPASATDTGTLGEIRIDGSYIYVCVATNTWKRSALGTW